MYDTKSNGRQQKRNPTTSELDALQQLTNLGIRELCVIKILALKTHVYRTDQNLADALGVSLTSVERWRNGRAFPPVEYCTKIDRLFAMKLSPQATGEIRVARAHHGWAQQRYKYERRMGLPKRTNQEHHRYNKAIPRSDCDSRRHPLCAAVERAVRLGMQDKIPLELVQEYNEIISGE